MSRPCEALEQVYQAYMEAMLARRGPWFQRQGLILFDELISFEMPSLSFEPETVQEFRQAMQNLETKAVEKSARKLLAQIDARSNEDENDQEAAILMRSHLVQLVLNHLTQLGMEREYFAQLYALDPQKGGDFAQQLLFLLKRACAAGQATDELYAAAVAFVQEHYTDQNLSLEDVAQAIGQNQDLCEPHVPPAQRPAVYRLPFRFAPQPGGGAAGAFGFADSGNYPFGGLLGFGELSEKIPRGFRCKPVRIPPRTGKGWRKKPCSRGLKKRFSRPYWANTM